MRIAMVSEHASPLAALGGADAGGQNVFVAELSTLLARRGHQVRVFTRSDDRSLPLHVRTPEGVEIHHVVAGPEEAIPKDEIFRYLGAFADGLMEGLQAFKPDVIHAHFWMSGLAALDARRRGAIAAPVVQSFHALGHVKRRHQPEEDTSPDQRVNLERYLANAVDAVIATCTDEVRELRELGTPTPRVHVIPCGVDTEYFTERESLPRSATVLTISRMVPRKGVDTVIRAIAQLPGVRLQVVGGPGSEWEKDPEVQRLRAVADELGVAGRVEFLGPVPRSQVPELMRRADVVATLPWYEPFGIVPLEAMACGVPVVGSAVGGLLDTVINGATGLLVPPKDHLTAAAAIARILASPERAEAMGQRGATRVRERYTWDSVASATEALYRDCATVIDLRESEAQHA